MTAYQDALTPLHAYVESLEKEVRRLRTEVARLNKECAGEVERYNELRSVIGQDVVALREENGRLRQRVKYLSAAYDEVTAGPR